MRALATAYVPRGHAMGCLYTLRNRRVSLEYYTIWNGVIAYFQRYVPFIFFMRVNRARPLATDGVNQQAIG